MVGGGGGRGGGDMMEYPMSYYFASRLVAGSKSFQVLV